MCESEYIQNIKGLYLLCKNIKVNNRIYNEYLKSKNSFLEKLYEDIPYKHIRKCVCNYNCSNCWKFTCESCEKGFNDTKLKCRNNNCYKHLKHTVPEVFLDPDINICLTVYNYHITFNEATYMEKNLKVDEKLIFVKLLL